MMNPAPHLDPVQHGSAGLIWRASRGTFWVRSMAALMAPLQAPLGLALGMSRHS